MSGVEDDPCPKRGETRIIDGSLCRFIERELEGDKWEVLGPAPTEQADGGVVVPRDQLETLRRSLELGSLLPGEGETLINCWIFASEAESKA
jgi:hypothetical protein